MPRRNRQIPLQAPARNRAPNVRDKHTNSDCYSITIRTGKGIDLGSISFSKVIQFLKEISRHYVLALEMDGDNQHLQGGIFTKKLERQDKLREKLLPYVISMWEEEMEFRGKVITFAARENVRKHALCVKPHNDWEVLVKYCLKDTSHFIGHSSPVDLDHIGFSCRHEVNKQNCKIYWRYGECPRSK